MLSVGRGKEKATFPEMASGTSYSAALSSAISTLSARAGSGPIWLWWGLCETEHKWDKVRWFIPHYVEITDSESTFQSLTSSSASSGALSAHPMTFYDRFAAVRSRPLRHCSWQDSNLRLQLHRRAQILMQLSRDRLHMATTREVPDGKCIFFVAKRKRACAKGDLAPTMFLFHTQ